MTASKKRVRRRLSWRGKLLLALGAPAVFLGLVELALTAAGYQVQDRPPLYERIRSRKKSGTVRIMILGGSAAAGFPFGPEAGPVPLLRELLRDVAPGQPTEVINCAVNALTSTGILIVARKIVAYEPDVLIVYAGHNEFFNDPELNLAVLRWCPDRSERPSWYRRTRTFAVLEDVKLMLRGGRPMEGEAPTRAERAQAGLLGSPRDYKPDILAAPYEARLREVVQVARDAGAEVLLCTLACNLKDAVPTRPELGEELSESEAAAWRAHYEKGQSFARVGRHKEATAAFAKAAAIDDTHAGLLFDQARTLYALGDYVRAKELFLAARDQDYMPMRATTQRNEAVRRVAKSLSVPLADAERSFAEASAHGCPGDELFFDYMHLLPEGALLLARCWAEALGRHRLLGSPDAVIMSRAAELDEYMSEIGLTSLRLAQAHALIGRRCADAEAGGRKVAAFRRRQFVEGLRARGRKQFADALRLDPHAADPMLGVFNPFVHCYIALGHNDLGRPGRAIEICKKVLDVIPTFALAYEGLVEAHTARGEAKEAAAARSRLAQLLGAGAGTSGSPREQDRKETKP